MDESGSVCRMPTMYKSDFCKNHQSQDPSVLFCMGKYASGKGCSRRAVVGELFCRQHISQKGDIEKLQCPRGCGLLTYRLWKESGYYYCERCKGAMLDAKRLETKLASEASIFNHLLQAEGEECSLKCPSCDGLMYEFKIVYVVPEGGGGGGLGNIGPVGDLGGGGGAVVAGIIVIVLVVAVISAVVSSSKKKDEGDDEIDGPVMAIDGCKDCGVFWFDGDELEIVKSAQGIRGAIDSDFEEAGEKKLSEPERLRIQSSDRATNSTCLHVDHRNGKKCRRVTYRGTEYCYMHQPK